MWQPRYETVNPKVWSNDHLELNSPSMDDVKFPSRPDPSLRGVRTAPHPNHPSLIDTSSLESIVPQKNTSFLWGANLRDIGNGFDHDAFLQMHRHLLSGNERPIDLEENLLERRKRVIDTYSSLESRGRAQSGMSSSQDTHLYAGISTPYDELTYEETLFEVKVDKLSQNKIEHQISEKMYGDLNYLKNRRMKTSGEWIPDRLTSGNHGNSTKNDRKRINDSSHHVNFAGIENELLPPQLKHNPLRQRSASFYHPNRTLSPFVKEEESTDELISDSLIKAYIEERIKTVEKQIRKEVSEETQQNTKKQSQKTEKINRSFRKQHNKSNNKVQNNNSSDNSSKDSILKEIVAVLIAKGYLHSSNGTLKQKNSSDDTSISEEDSLVTKKSSNEVNRSVRNHKNYRNIKSQMIESDSPDINKKFHNLPQMPRSNSNSFKKSSNSSLSKTDDLSPILSPSSTFKSHKDSRRQQSLDSGRSSLHETIITTSGHSLIESAEARRRRLKSFGSRTSLTSLLRTQDSSSSDNDQDTKSRTITSSFKRSRHKSSGNKEISNQVSFNEKLPQDSYDNVDFTKQPEQKETLSNFNNENGYLSFGSQSGLSINETYSNICSDFDQNHYLKSTNFKTDTQMNRINEANSVKHTYSVTNEVKKHEKRLIASQLSRSKSELPPPPPSRGKTNIIPPLPPPRPKKTNKGPCIITIPDPPSYLPSPTTSVSLPHDFSPEDLPPPPPLPNGQQYQPSTSSTSADYLSLPPPSQAPPPLKAISPLPVPPLTPMPKEMVVMNQISKGLPPLPTNTFNGSLPPIPPPRRNSRSKERTTSEDEAFPNYEKVKKNEGNDNQSKQKRYYEKSDKISTPARTLTPNMKPLQNSTIEITSVDKSVLQNNPNRETSAVNPSCGSPGQSSGTSLHHEDRSASDYFLMDDHMTGITYTSFNYH